MKHSSPKVPHHARVPLKEVLENPAISDRGKLVYSLMAAWVFEGSVARIGLRKIARDLGFSLATACRKAEELEVAGLIVKTPTARGQRRLYFLKSDLFGQKQGTETIIRSSPRGSRMVSVAVEDVA